MECILQCDARNLTSVSVSNNILDGLKILYAYMVKGGRQSKLAL